MKALWLVGAALTVSPSLAVAQTAPPPAAPAAVDPAVEAAAVQATAKLVPEGVYARMMRDQFPALMDAMMEQMFGMSAKDLGVGTDGTSLGAEASAKDPAFRERMQIMTRVMSQEMAGVMGKLEPRIRVGLAKAFARKFTLQQLNDMNAFFATSSGTVFANEYLATFADPDLMREMMTAMPEILKAMPAIMQKVEDATKHLPPPPKPKGDTK